MRGHSCWSKVLVVLLALLIAGMGQLVPIAALSASAQTPPPVKPTGTLPPTIGTIKVGLLPSLSAAPLLVAAEKGFFEEQGLKVEFQQFRAAAEMIPFLSTGGLDAAGTGIGTGLFNAVGQGLDVRIVATLFSEPPGYGAVPVLVRKDLFESGQITKPADLKGRKVALNEIRGMVEYILSEALARGGLTVDDVQITVVPLPDMPAALANKAVDLAMTSPPFHLKAIEDGSAVILFKGDEITDTPQFGALYFGRRLLDPANREVAIRFLAAFLKGAREIYGDRWRNPDNIAILNKYIKFPPAVIEKTDHFYCDPNGQINKASVEKFQAYCVGRGYTELLKPLDLSQVITDTFLTEALERVGRFEPPQVTGGGAPKN